jgi:hypothetical protein
MDFYMDEFLKLEYEQCLGLIKYYDERHQSLVKFCAGLSSAVPSLLLAIFQLGSEVTPYFWKFTTLISGVTAIGLLAIYTVLIQTRLYFIYPARQVNAIRRTVLSTHTGFTDNQMYLDTSFNALKWTSSHTLLNAFVALQIGSFISLVLYSVCWKSLNTIYFASVTVGVGFVSACIVFGLSAWYLHTKSQYHPDRSVHGQRP